MRWLRIRLRSRRAREEIRALRGEPGKKSVDILQYLEDQPVIEI